MPTQYMTESMRPRREKTVSVRRIDRKRTNQAKLETRTRKQQRAIKRGL